MRFAPHDVRRARLRRGPLVALSAAGFGSLVVSALLPRLEPWLGPPRAGLLVLTAGAAAGAAATLVGARRAPAWSSADDVAWVVSLGALAVLAATCTAPLGAGMLLFAAALVTLAARDPSGALVVIACASASLLPVLRALFAPTAGHPSTTALAAGMALMAFIAVLSQTRRLGRALAEREAALFERAPASSSSSSSSTRSTGGASGRSSSPGVRAPALASSERAGSEASSGGSSSSSSSSSGRSSGLDGNEQSWDALVERVRSSITVMAESAGVAASVQAELSGLAPPSSKIRAHLVRIAQEAITQALRHAEPRSITVTLRRGEGGVVFELQDDGRANDSMRQKRSLATLRGRVAALGGTAEVRRADKGWVTKVRLPCEQLN